MTNWVRVKLKIIPWLERSLLAWRDRRNERPSVEFAPPTQTPQTDAAFWVVKPKAFIHIIIKPLGKIGNFLSRMYFYIVRCALSRKTSRVAQTEFHMCCQGCYLQPLWFFWDSSHSCPRFPFQTFPVLVTLSAALKKLPTGLVYGIGLIAGRMWADTVRMLRLCSRRRCHLCTRLVFHSRSSVLFLSHEVSHTYTHTNPCILCQHPDICFSEDRRPTKCRWQSGVWVKLLSSMSPSCGLFGKTCNRRSLPGLFLKRSGQSFRLKAAGKCCCAVLFLCTRRARERWRPHHHLPRVLRLQRSARGRLPQRGHLPDKHPQVPPPQKNPVRFL